MADYTSTASHHGDPYIINASFCVSWARRHDTPLLATAKGPDECISGWAEELVELQGKTLTADIGLACKIRRDQKAGHRLPQKI